MRSDFSLNNEQNKLYDNKEKFGVLVYLCMIYFTHSILFLYYPTLVPLPPKPVFGV